MLAGEIDIAVHSYKDIPTEDVVGLRVIPVTQREDYRDALISKSGKKFMELPVGSVIGTGSLRRSAQLKQIRPDLEYKFIQGNVDGRIHKMETEGYDAVILAVSGLKRLNMLNVVTDFFDDKVMLPAVGQGILGVELIDKESYVLNMVKKIVHEPTKNEAYTERAYLIALGGGCNLPIAAHAIAKGDKITIDGFFATEDGKFCARDTISGTIENKKIIARKLALQLKEKVESELKLALSNVNA